MLYGYPLWWALAIGVALGGNGTHVGATANIIVVAQAEKSGIPGGKITPLEWIKIGAPVMFVGLVLALSLIHISEPTRLLVQSRIPSYA